MSNLLKEAIADAKAVRATALANAKLSLVESINPRFNAMFAEKLKEEAESEFESEENAGSSDVDTEIDSLIKELEDEVDDEGGELDSETDGEFGDEEGAPDSEFGDEVGGDTEGEPVGDLDGEMGDQEPDVDLDGEMGGDDVAGSEIKPGDPIPAGTPVIIQPVSAGTSTPDLDAPVSGEEGEEGDEEEINLEELLNSLDEDEDVVQESVPVKTSGIGTSDNKKPSSDAHDSSRIESGKKSSGAVSGYKAVGEKRPNSSGDIGGTPSLKEKGDCCDTAKRPNSTGDIGDTASLSEELQGLRAENKKLKLQLKESKDAVVFIKGELNEVNLLNAKLLYTNKLFKEFNVNNEQKMRIIEMFDLSKNVREVKLTYATIAESLNFSESTSKKKISSTVSRITEGMASKPVGSTKPAKEIISESAGLVSKFQKLAGIRK